MINFTYACGHYGILACSSYQPDAISFISGTICASCRTIAAMKAFGIELNPIESTDWHCSICGDVFPLENLALQLDGNRICDGCDQENQRLVEVKLKLEAQGQTRLF